MVVTQYRFATMLVIYGYFAAKGAWGLEAMSHLRPAYRYRRLW
jgi:hypothetical protein